MSEKIYFNTSNKFSLKRTLVNVSTRLHHTVAPKHAEKRFYWEREKKLAPELTTYFSHYF